MQLLSGKNRFKPECYHFQRSDAPSESTYKISTTYGGKNVITPGGNQLAVTIYDYTEKIMYNNVPCYRNSFIRKNTVMHCFINFPYINELHCHSIIETFQRTAWVLSNRYQSRNIDKLKTVFWDKTDLSYSVSNSPIKKYLSKNFRY